MKKKVMIYDDEYYPFYFIIEADKDDNHFVYEINEDLFNRYTNIRNSLKEIEDEIKTIVGE